MQCSFSLTQIGEFSFIIASLGVQLGVMSDYLYPVIVAVSIITTFLTPYSIRAAEPAYALVMRILPKALTQRLTRRNEQNQKEELEKHPWHTLLVSMLSSTVAYFVITWATIGISFQTLLPFFRAVFGHYLGNAITGLIALTLCALFLRPIVMKALHSTQVKKWKQTNEKKSLVLFGLTFLLRYLLAVWVAFYIIEYLSPYRWYYHLLLAVFFMYLITRERIGKRKNLISKWVKYNSVRIERNFLHNLRARDVRAQAARPGYEKHLQKMDVHLSQIKLPANSSWAGQRLSSLNFTQEYGVTVAAIIRDNSRLNIPDGQTVLFPGDKLEVIGDDARLKAFIDEMQKSLVCLTPDNQAHRLVLSRFMVGINSPFLGKTLMESGIREDYQCMVVGFDSRETESEDNIEQPQATHVFMQGDTVWVVGERLHIKALQKAALGAGVLS